MDATTNIPTEKELAIAIELATEQAVSDLFRTHRQHFYYLALITYGYATSPLLSAWSWEALEAAVANESDKERAKYLIKWSYADSPFCSYADHCFQQVQALFDLRPQMHLLNGAKFFHEYDLRLSAMEAAMAQLDIRGVFGSGEPRSNLLINVEVMPPDYTNTSRAIRLNPPGILGTWLEEAGEE